MESSRAELIGRMARACPQDGRIEPFNGLFLARASAPMPPVYSVAQPCFCVIAQGRKAMHLGDKTHHYDAQNFLLSCLELPASFQVLEASLERPYLGLRLNLDPVLIGSILVEIGTAAPATGKTQAVEVSPLDSALLDAVLRMVRLIDSPGDANFLLPLLKREIVYRLLKGEQGKRLRRMMFLGGHSHRIARAAEKIAREFSQTLRVEELARECGMSVSGFHQHFKAITALSPLQFQKQVRLQEARRLLLGQNLDAATAGYRVGYDDASHFTREYKRFFGAPPMRDVEQLRAASAI